MKKMAPRTLNELVTGVQKTFRNYHAKKVLQNLKKKAKKATAEGENVEEEKTVLAKVG